ncbi:hypothetical protein QM306_18755, partial [Burkholderia cenocepacia]|nr:hypothetical protein [Burkholderia cenocepacia]
MSDPRTLHIYRYDPDRDTAPYMQRFEIDVNPDDRMLLDVPGRHGACVPFPHRTATAPHHAAPEGMHIMISHIELLGRLLLAALL